MHYLITGGTGLIGSALARQLLADGHEVTVWSRQPSRVALRCGQGARGVAELTALGPGTQIGVVVNLAGAPIADKRWSAARKDLLWRSRIDLTTRLVQWMQTLDCRPGVLVSGSAVGWYGDGDGGDRKLTEASDFNNQLTCVEFTHALCDAWEQAALQAEDLGVRVCLVRTGLVLAPDGGFLKKMLLPFRLGLGGQLGSGKQYMPWIHLEDEVRLIRFLAEHKNIQNVAVKGPYNACAPNPVTNRQFTKTLAHLLRRPAFMCVPRWLLKAGLGELSRLLLTGQRVLPEKAQAAGFQFRFTELSDALVDVLREAP